MLDMKILANAKGDSYFIKDSSKDYHCKEGVIFKEDLQKPDGSIIKSKLGKEFSVFTPSFYDLYRKISRLAQIIPLKDVGMIIAECGIGKNTVVFDAGSGSGGTSLFIANIAKKVSTFDIREDHLNIVKKNIEFLDLKNITAKLHDIYRSSPDKNADVFILDVPEPWLALENAKDSIKVGGFIVSYSPSIPQAADFVNAVLKDSSLTHLKTVEMIQREWEVNGRKVRPTTAPVGHSGFISFIRRIS